VARTRNLRLTAIRSFFRYAAFEAPAHADQIQRVLAIPSQRFMRAQVGFLTRPEVEALLAAPDQHTWSGRRDHAILLLAVQSGLRLSELTAVRRDAVILGMGAHVRVVGKGRKERATPLTKQTVAVLRAWLREIPDRADAIVFPSARGARLSADGVQYLLNKHLAVASKRCSSLQQRRVTPHMLRHTTAMELLLAGMDRALIALWLGHESVQTTQIYLDANLAMKEQALAKTAPPEGKPGRYRPDDQLMAFLKGL
jgi:site-specific recombinase XerD